MIIDAVVFGMIDVPELRRLYRVTRGSTSGSRSPRSSACCRRACWPASSIGVVLSLGWLVYVATTPADAAARPRARDAGVPRPRRAPWRRDPPRHRGAAARQRPLLRHRRSARGPRPRARPEDGAAPRAAVVLDLEGVTSSTRRAPSSSPRSSELVDEPATRRCAWPASSRRSRGARTPTASSTGSARRPHPRQRRSRRRSAQLSSLSSDDRCRAGNGGRSATARRCGGRLSRALSRRSASDESDETVPARGAGDALVKVRDGLMDVKRLRAGRPRRPRAVARRC